jgi:hypothetical protein
MADAPNANDELYPIAVLIDELKVTSSSRIPFPLALLLLPVHASISRCPNPSSSSLHPARRSSARAHR